MPDVVTIMDGKVRKAFVMLSSEKFTLMSKGGGNANGFIETESRRRLIIFLVPKLTVEYIC